MIILTPLSKPSSRKLRIYPADETDRSTPTRRQVLAGVSALGALLASGGGLSAQTAGYDVILLAGQSNMTGFGMGEDDSADASPNRRVLQWDANRGAIFEAVDPLVQNEAPSHVGLGLTFGKSYLRSLAPDRSILLVGAAHGATSFASGRWRAPDGDLVQTAVARANAAMRAAGAGGRFAGILWHQGEGDITESGGDTYAQSFYDLIQYFRSRIEGASAATPFVAGELVYPWLAANFSKPRFHGGELDILKAIHELPDKVPYTAWVSAMGLPQNETQLVHFSALSQRQLGKRYADKFFEARNNLPQPEVSLVAWNGVPGNNGRVDFDTEQPLNQNGKVAGSIKIVRDQLLGNAVEIARGGGQIHYTVPAGTFRGSYTKMVWFRPAGGNYQNYLIAGHGPGLMHFLRAYRTDTGLLIAGGHDPKQIAPLVSKEFPFAADKWLNIALVFDGSRGLMTLYVNGASVAEANAVKLLPPSGPTDIIMGALDDNPSTGLDGVMARNRVWSVALTSAQLTLIHNYESRGLAGF